MRTSSYMNALPTVAFQHRQRDDIEESLQGYAEGSAFDMTLLRDQRWVVPSDLSKHACVITPTLRRRHVCEQTPPSLRSSF